MTCIRKLGHQMSLSLSDLYITCTKNMSAATNMSFIFLLEMMDDSMFTCYYCHAKMYGLQCVVGHCKRQHCDVSGHLSYLNFISTNNTYQSIYLNYPVSQTPDDCQIYLQNGTFILRVCEYPVKETTKVHSNTCIWLCTFYKIQETDFDINQMHNIGSHRSTIFRYAPIHKGLNGASQIRYLIKKNMTYS